MRNPQWLSHIGGILLNKEDVCYCLTDWGRKPSFPVESSRMHFSFKLRLILLLRVLEPKVALRLPPTYRKKAESLVPAFWQSCINRPIHPEYAL